MHLVDDVLTVICGDALEELRKLPSESVHCCVTSPPYWGLRDYGTAAWEGGEDGCDHLEPQGGTGIASAKQNTSVGSQIAQFKSDCGKCGAKRIDSQLGLEKTPEEYVAKMVGVFREVRRVLRRDGTLWLNLGDSYAQSGGKMATDSEREASVQRAKDRNYDVSAWGASERATNGIDRAANTAVSGLKPKDLCGIPWKLAFALRADGWWLRSDIIWAKPNPMPESCTDRPTKSHEYIFLLTKSANYFWDAEAIREPHAEPWRGQGEKENYTPINSQGWNGDGFPITKREYNPAGRNKRSVWTIATQPYPEAHFATFPEEIPKLCILAGTSAKGCCAKCGAPWERVVDISYVQPDSRWGTKSTPRRLEKDQTMIGYRPDAILSKQSKTLGWQPTCKCDAGIEPCVCLDPFAGSGTTAAVALELGRRAVLIELNPAYVKLIHERCTLTPGLALA